LKTQGPCIAELVQIKTSIHGLYALNRQNRTRMTSIYMIIRFIIITIIINVVIISFYLVRGTKAQCESSLTAVLLILLT